FFTILERGAERLSKLSELASVRFGVKTGANEFFYVTSHECTSGSTDPGTAGLSPGPDPETQLESHIADTESSSRIDGRAPMAPLQKMGAVRRGLTTGANEFFYVRAVDRDIADTPARDPGHRRESDRPASENSLSLVEDRAGARRMIESRFLAPVLFSLKEIPGIIIKPGQ